MPNYVASLASPVLLTASTTQTMVLVNPAVVSFKVAEISVSFDGSAVAAAIRADLYRVTNATGIAGASITPVKINDPSASTAAQSTAQGALSGEPTTVEVLRSWFVSPASGLIIVQFPLGREPKAAGTGGHIGLRVTTPASVTPHCMSYIDFEE